MKLLLVLSVLCQLGQSVAKDASPEEFASQLYQKSSEKVVSFFKTAGIPATDFVHPSLRSEETELHPRATAHFTYYKDSDCTELNYMVDQKISRCLNRLGNQKIRIVSEDASSWTLAFDQYDAACENYLGVASEMHTFTKNACVPSGDAYVTFNLIAHPLKAIPGGGGAFVYYDNLVDCQISKHVNLARAETVITLPNNVCTYGGFNGYTRITSCNAIALRFNFYTDNLCTLAPLFSQSFSTVHAESCPNMEPVPFQTTCILDSGTASG
jgi:hypothetical protein